MVDAMENESDKNQSLHALEATNFFLADVQTGLGPFLAAYLAGAGWEPGRIGMALTIGGIITVVLQAPAGAIVDQLRSKKLILLLASAVLAVGAVLLSITAAPWAVYSVTNIDGDVISWRFIALGSLPVAVITSPRDERLLTTSSETLQETLKVRAKFWGEVEAVEAVSHLDGQTLPMKRVGGVVLCIAPPGFCFCTSA